MQNDPTRRALRLLSLLPTRRKWAGAELAARLDVTERTVRRDIDRLRGMGYPVDATPGVEGGYRLSAGASLPPLILDDDEAVALAVGLRAASGIAIRGVDQAAVKALAKIESVLPLRVRTMVSALDAQIVSLSRAQGDREIVVPRALIALAAACRDHEEVHFTYRRPDGDEIRRWVEPHQVLSAGSRWYLIAWDLGREDWRTFRLDRLSDVGPAGGRFEPRDIPGGDAAAFFSASVTTLLEMVEAIVIVRAPYASVGDALSLVHHTPVEEAADSCRLRLRATELESLLIAVAKLAIRAPIRVVEPDELATEVEALIANLRVRDP